MMKRILVLCAAIAIAGCAVNHSKSQANTYDKPFYTQFLNTGSALDWRIQQTLEGLRANPKSASLHNELGSLLVLKQFPNDAEREFERAVDADSHFYPAWYNLGLVRESKGDFGGARRAFRRAVHYRKGHGPSLFELGMMAEKSGDSEEAIAYYAKAFRHNRELLDVRYNPRILNSKLIDMALLRNYDLDEARVGAVYAATPLDYVQPQPKVVTPAPAATDTAAQTKKP